ncbi:MAG: HEAT repeat domain-containing protein [Planctomycetota bacterium]|nr:HEAT repeat domain-containing protein [Planctomycetota bacterium]
MGLFKKLFGGSSEPTERVLAIMERMRSEDPLVRKAACEEIADLGDEAAPATGLLEDLIQDVDGDVCNAAAAAISKATRGY